MSNTHIEVERQGQVATLRLKRPEKHNACTTLMLETIGEAMRKFESDADVRCIVIVGDGPSFCSGSDISEIRSLSPDEAAHRTQLDYAAKLAVAMSSKITLAAIHGYCLGGGLELAAACDLRIAARDAAFGLPEVALGSIPGSGGVQRLSGLVGFARAKDWVLTGKRFGVDEAWSAGLLSEVVEEGRVHARALELAAELARRNPLAVQVCKTLLDPNSPRAPNLDSMIHGLVASNLRHIGALDAVRDQGD